MNNNEFKEGDYVRIAVPWLGTIAIGKVTSICKETDKKVYICTSREKKTWYKKIHVFHIED